MSHPAVDLALVPNSLTSNLPEINIIDDRGFTIVNLEENDSGSAAACERQPLKGHKRLCKIFFLKFQNDDRRML